jgi:hypothetical protein
MAIDLHKNFAYSTVATAPSPATTGTSLVVAAGAGSKFPTPPFNATIWPVSTQPTTTNAEIVRVTAISTDTLTITRAQETSTARSVTVGDQIAATVTAKTLTDIDANYVNSWSPYVVASGGTGVLSLGATNQSSTGTLVLMPFQLTNPVRFNQIILPVSLSYVTSASAETINNTYYSYFALYSVTGNTLLTRISSNSFSIAETLGSVSLTWNYPTSTATTGYAYGTSIPGAGNLTTTAQISSYISGSRILGLQFGGEMSLTANNYWLGLLALRSTAGGHSTYGLSNAGVIGHIMNPINQGGTVSGMLPLGLAGAEWGQKNTNISGWFGRNMALYVTQSTFPNFGGTVMPANISFMEFAGSPTPTNATINPSFTFVST